MVVNFLITLALVVAMQTFSGNSGIVSFGHVAYMGIGAYTAALLTIPLVLKESSCRIFPASSPTPSSDSCPRFSSPRPSAARWR